jgi:hypothetical protein
MRPESVQSKERKCRIALFRIDSNVRFCEAVRPGARALICRLPAGAPALLSEHCERLWLRPRAELLAEAGVEVPVLCGPQGGAMLEQAGSFRWHRGSRYRVNPGPKGRRLGLRAFEPVEAGLSSSYDFTSRPDGLARVVV